MFKYLLLLLVAAIAWRVWLKRPPASDAASRRTERAPERMVACAVCGVLMPESDALAEDGRHYCGEAHRQAAVRGRQ